LDLTGSAKTPPPTCLHNFNLKVEVLGKKERGQKREKPARKERERTRKASKPRILQTHPLETAASRQPRPWQPPFTMYAILDLDLKSDSPLHLPLFRSIIIKIELDYTNYLLFPLVK
jgi:hypothetical protein